jgi:hypothetical protein
VDDEFIKGAEQYVFPEKALYSNAFGRRPGQPTEGFDPEYRKAGRTFWRQIPHY